MNWTVLNILNPFGSKNIRLFPKQNGDGKIKGRVPRKKVIEKAEEKVKIEDYIWKTAPMNKDRMRKWRFHEKENVLVETMNGKKYWDNIKILMWNH
jgi:hypothetical protein